MAIHLWVMYKKLRLGNNRLGQLVITLLASGLKKIIHNSLLKAAIKPKLSNQHSLLNILVLEQPGCDSLREGSQVISLTNLQEDAIP